VAWILIIASLQHLSHLQTYPQPPIVAHHNDLNVYCYSCLHGVNPSAQMVGLCRTGEECVNIPPIHTKVSTNHLQLGSGKVESATCANGKDRDLEGVGQASGR